MRPLSCFFYLNLENARMHVFRELNGLAEIYAKWKQWTWW